MVILRRHVKHRLTDCIDLRLILGGLYGGAGERLFFFFVFLCV